MWPLDDAAMAALTAIIDAHEDYVNVAPSLAE